MLKELYKWYDILPSNPNAQTRVDLSMIFAYRCMDKYLVEGGMFGFLINDAAFKAMADDGFRKFRIKRMIFKVKVIHDLVNVKPSNREHQVLSSSTRWTDYISLTFSRTQKSFSYSSHTFFGFDKVN
jgi:hypothetical protein